MFLSRRESLLRTLSTWWAGATARLFAAGPTPDSPASDALPPHVTPEVAAAINAGHAWLVGRQRSDGGFGRDGSYARNVGVCALAGLALLAAARRARRTSSAVRGCTDYLLRHARDDGFIVEDVVRTHAPHYGHGYATTFLGQVCGSDRRREVGRALRAAVQWIIAAQSPAGGWHYNPSPDDADVSVSTCQLQALHSARQAGVDVPPEPIRRGLEFVLQCRNPDGGFRYRLVDPPESLPPRTAAAVATLCTFGLREHSVVAAGLAYLQRPHEMPASSGGAEYYFYGAFYKAWAARFADEQYSADCYCRLRDALLARRSGDGCWHDPNIGDEYATAMALLVLQMPYDSLPLYLPADL
ncbi:MAG: terpene cyclase/mutase family protein [Pirellulales bacterium]